MTDKQRKFLKTIRCTNDELESDVAQAIGNPGRFIQFCRDVQYYNLFEAIQMSPGDVRDEVERVVLRHVQPDRPTSEILAQLNWTHSDKRDLKPAQAVPSCADSWQPDAKWRIRRDMVLERAHQLTLATNASGRTRFESIIRAAVSDLTLVECTLRTAKISFIEAVESLPIQFRMLVMARVMKTLDIPDPIEPRTSATRIFVPLHDPEGPERSKIFILDHVGNAWSWNMGWRRIGDDGQPLEPNKPPLGHTTFRRSIKQASPEQLGLTSFRHTRPYGMWRKANGRISHGLWGNGELQLTDGLHAIVKFEDGHKREVVLANCRNIGEKTFARLQRQANKKQTRTDRKVADIMKQLEGIL